MELFINGTSTLRFTALFLSFPQRFAGETLKSRLRSTVILDSSGKQGNFTNFLSQGLIVLLFLAHVCVKPFLG